MDERALNNTLAISGMEVCKGRTGVLPVELNNTESITAFQFEVTLPDGIALSKCQLTGRKGNDHTTSFKKMENGHYQVTGISLSKETFSGTEGTLVNLTIGVGDAVAAGNYTVGIGEIELTTADTKAIHPADVSATLAVSDVKLGDANGDGKISITDAVAIVSHILGSDPEGFAVAAADVNGDGKVSITDAVAVVDMILNGEASAKKRDFEAEDVLDPQ